MADYDFPPLLQGEGPSLDAAAILGAQARGEWARTFGEHGAGTGPGRNNLITRRNHNRDIQRETEVNQQLQEEHQINELKTSKGALDAYVRGKTLDMNMKLGKANLDRIAQQVDAKERMLPIEMEAKQASTRAALAREEATIKSTGFKARLEEQKNSDTAGFVNEIETSGAKRGTPEFAETVAKARRKYAAMDHALFADVWKTHTGSELEPDEALKRVEAVESALPGMRVTAKLPGGITATSLPDSSGKDRKTLQDRYDKYLFHRSSSSVDPAQIGVLDKEIGEMKKQLDGLDKPAASAAAPKVRKFNPATGKIE